MGWAPTRAEMLQAFEEQTCPWCGGGPFQVLALHTVGAHGITSAALRDIAGIPRTTSKTRTTSEAVRKRQSERTRQMCEEGILPRGGAVFTRRVFSPAGKGELVKNSRRVGSDVGNREENKRRLVELAKSAQGRERARQNGQRNLGRKLGPMSPEHRQKISLAKTGVSRSPEVVQGMRERAARQVLVRDPDTGRIVTCHPA